MTHFLIIDENGMHDRNENKVQSECEDEKTKLIKERTMTSMQCEYQYAYHQLGITKCLKGSVSGRYWRQAELIG